MNKKLKLPSPFLPQIKKADFELKIIKRIHVQSEVDFARGLYRENEEGLLVWSAELDKKETKRLKTLAKEIKKNRGFVSWGKFAVLGVLLALVLVFYLVFKNMLVTGWLEGALEGAFGAKAEIAGLDFDPLGGRFAWDGVQVADKEHPMKNLFQLGRTEFKLNSWQLVNGRVLIENLECSDVRFATDRKTSGALPHAAPSAAPAPAAPAAQGAGPSLDLDAFADLKKLDAASLVNDQWKNLETSKMVDQLKTQLGNPQDRLAQERTGVQAKAQSLVQASGDRILKNLQSVRSPSEIQDALKKSTDFQAEIEAARKEAQASQDRLQTEFKQYQAQVANLQATALRDADKLKKMASNPQGLGNDIVKKVLGQILGPKTKELLGWADKARNAAGALQSGDPKQAKPDLKGGRVVNFPVPQKPTFWIQNIKASVWFDAQHQALVKATGITSDPDMIGEPVRITLVYAENNFKAQADGILDNRKGTSEVLKVNAQVSGYPFVWTEGIGVLGAKSVSGTFGGTGTLVQNTQGVTTLKAQGAVAGLKMDPADDGLMAKVTKAALTASKNQVNGALDGQWGGPNDAVNVSTNLDAAFAQAFRSAAEAEVKNLQANIQKEMDKKIDEALGGKANADQFRKLMADNTADIKSLDDVKAKADKQVADLEKLKQLLSDPSKIKNSLKLPF